MADIINLNRMRKRRAKVAAETQAEANRAKFGRTKAQKARDEAERRRIDEALDGSKRD